VCGEYVEMDFMACDFNDVEVAQVLAEGQLNGLKRWTLEEDPEASDARRRHRGGWGD
jgi:hypothetical protein